LIVPRQTGSLVKVPSFASALISHRRYNTRVYYEAYVARVIDENEVNRKLRPATVDKQKIPGERRKKRKKRKQKITVSRRQKTATPSPRRREVRRRRKKNKKKRSMKRLLRGRGRRRNITRASRRRARTDISTSVASAKLYKYCIPLDLILPPPPAASREEGLPLLGIR
jgi:hypothetical protein